MLKTLQDCYQIFTDYFFPSVKTDLSQTEDTPFPFANIQAYGTDLGNTELSVEQSARAAESTGLITYTGTMSNEAYI